MVIFNSYVKLPEGIWRKTPYILLHKLCIYIYICGGQNYLLPAMDMAKVGGPLLVVKVCAQF